MPQGVVIQGMAVVSDYLVPAVSSSTSCGRSWPTSPCRSCAPPADAAARPQGAAGPTVHARMGHELVRLAPRGHFCEPPGAHTFVWAELSAWVRPARAD